MNIPAHLCQPLKVIHGHFQNKRDSSHGKDLLHFDTCMPHSHFQLIHLNFPKHSHIVMASYVNSAYCNKILTFFLSFSFQSHFTLQTSFPQHLWDGKCPSVTGGELEVHEIKQFAKCHTRSQWQHQRQVAGFSVILLGILQNHSFSTTDTQTVYETGISTNSIYF